MQMQMQMQKKKRTLPLPPLWSTNPNSYRQTLRPCSIAWLRPECPAPPACVEPEPRRLGVTSASSRSASFGRRRSGLSAKASCSKAIDLHPAMSTSERRLTGFFSVARMGLKTRSRRQRGNTTTRRVKTMSEPTDFERGTKVHETTEGRVQIDQAIARLRGWCLLHEIPWKPRKGDDGE